MSKKILQFTGYEMVAEIIEKMPEATDILMAHGLHCVGCHIGAFESLYDGASMHGFTENEIDRLVEDLNFAAQELNVEDSAREMAKEASHPPILTKNAAAKIKQLQKEEQQEGYGFKIEVIEKDGKYEYDLDFLDSPDEDDTVLESKGIQLFIAPESLQKLQGYTIDFLEKKEGFTIEKK